MAVAIVPGTASANHGTTCSYTSTQNQIVNAGGVVVYTGTGMSGAASTAVGACIYDPVSAGGFTFAGGTAEVGTGTNTDGSTGVYAIVDGDNANAGDPTGSGDGYVGVSNFETGTKGNCTAGSGTGTNSGGCLGIKPLGLTLPVPLLVCGNTSGNTWDAATRDGCALP